MATDGCWGPMCEFTGSRTKSDATPGRCTGEGGYIALAEINEILGRSVGARSFHDSASNSDIILYKGDYISYMTDTTKNTRRNDWKGLNFAGSIDWAVDLQEFTTDDYDAPPKNGKPGERGCVGGRDINVNAGDLCAFSCSFDFCPETLCECRVEGKIKALPAEVGGMDDIIALDELDVDLNRLCKFACKHGFCPDTICIHPVVDPDEDGVVMYDPENDPTQFDKDAARRENAMTCLIYKDPKYRDASVDQCYSVCKPAMDEAKEAGRTTNYGCMGFYPTAQYPNGIPWQKYPGKSIEVAPARCSCDNWLLNEIVDTVIEALPMIAQVRRIEPNYVRRVADVSDRMLHPHVFAEVRPRRRREFPYWRHRESHRGWLRYVARHCVKCLVHCDTPSQAVQQSIRPSLWLYAVRMG
jgi:hypothetical protein